MSLQKSFSRDPFLFSQERNKSYRKVTSCVDGVIALASTVSHLRSGYEPWEKEPLRYERKTRPQLCYTQLQHSPTVLYFCAALNSKTYTNTTDTHATPSVPITITTTVSKSKTHNSFLIQQSIPNTPVRTQSERKRRLCHTHKPIPNTPVLKHRLIPNSKNHIKQTLNVRYFSVTAGRWPYSRIQTTISQEPH